MKKTYFFNFLVKIAKVFHIDFYRKNKKLVTITLITHTKCTTNKKKAQRKKKITVLS